MSRFLLIVFITALVGFGHSEAQTFDMPENIEEFGTAVKQNLHKISSQNALQTGETFEAKWSSFGSDVRVKMIQQTKEMAEKGYKIKPFFTKYFYSLILALDTERIQDQQLVGYLNMTGEVVENQTPAELISYLNSMINFFSGRALFYSPTNQLLVSNGTYTFEYYGSASIDLTASMTDDLVEDPYVNDSDEEDYIEMDDEYEYEDEYYEDEYQDDYSEDEYGDDYFEDDQDDYQDEEYLDDEMIEEYLPDPPPILDGPVIRFSSVDLVIRSGKKEATIAGTQGSFLVIPESFSGEGGSIDWSTGGRGEEDIRVAFSQYNFNVRSPSFQAKVVDLKFDSLFSVPVQGEFSYDGTKGKDGIKFTSYRGDIEYKNLGRNSISLQGGVTLWGIRILTKSKQRKISRLEITEKSLPKLRSEGFVYELRDSLIISSSASVSIFHKRDSIFHPSVILRLNTSSGNITALSGDGGYRYTPFKSSFTNMDITANLIYWNIDSDSLEISILEGVQTELPVILQSNEYYRPDVLMEVSQRYNFNPVKMVVQYSRETRRQEFYAADITDYFDLNYLEVENALKELAQLGYVLYDRGSSAYKIQRKARHYALNKRGYGDHDNLLILSKVSSGPNVIFDMGSDEMYINGIERFYISEVLDVYIIPDSNRITLGENRSLNFNGRLYAGNFEYVGKDFKFMYDSFLIDLNNIEKIQFYVKDENDPNAKKTKINNVISGITEEDSISNAGLSEFEGTSGTLYVDLPKNKSGRQIYPNYPKFEGGGAGSIVYFSGDEYLDGVYGKSLYFILPPFNLDSLADSDPAAINFNGAFHSRGLMPEFNEKLHIMPDQSLGFEHSVSPEGYPLFEGDAIIFNRIILDRRGLRSEGLMKYLTADIQSEDFTYYPDSIVANGLIFDMSEEEFKGLTYPKMYVEDYDLKWLTAADRMEITNKSSPIQLYDELAALDGEAVVTHKGVYGEGNLLSLGSETNSKEFHFEYDRIRARHSDFEIKSNDPEKPALAGTDVRLNFDLLRNSAEISPEIEGEAALEFPYAQFKTSIPTAIWDLAEAKVTMSKPENIDIESSYFYTTREDLDSLHFSATEAVYDINTLELKVSGIPFIQVADAKITPENGEVLVLENSRIGTLTNTTIVIDTLNGYHSLYDGTIDIISRNEFLGSATYEFINAVQDTFAIKLEDFHLEEIIDNKGRAAGNLQTIATGEVTEEDRLIISPGMFYRGGIKMAAREPALELDGYVKLDLKRIDNYDTWIKYTSDAEQQEVIFNFDESITDMGNSLTAGLHFDYDDFSFYSTFVTNKHDPGDEDFFVPSGQLSFKADSGEYVIVNEDKYLGLSYEGKMMVYKERTGDLHIEGPVQFITNSKDVAVDAAVIADGNLETNEFDFDALITLDFNLPTGIYEMVARGFREGIDLVGAPEAIEDRTAIIYKLADFVGNKAAVSYEQRSIEEYTSLISISPKLVKPFTFSEINLKWDEEQNAFYNADGVLGLSNILRNDFNGKFEGFMEIRKGVDGDRIDLFLKPSPEYWFYFSFADNKLLVYSSDDELNQFVNQKTNQGKTKINEFVFAPGDIGETQNFVNTFRKIYYGINEPYELGGAIKVEDKEKTTDDDDDGF